MKNIIFTVVVLSIFFSATSSRAEYKYTPQDKCESYYSMIVSFVVARLHEVPEAEVLAAINSVADITPQQFEQSISDLASVYTDPDFRKLPVKKYNECLNRIKHGGQI
jgi:predicted Co/Zn/Cd cation transporter (cation efflux family)